MQGAVPASRSDALNQARTKTVPVSYEYDAHGNRPRVMHPDGNFFEYAYAADYSLMFISVVRRLADPHLPAHIRNRLTGIPLLQSKQDRR